MSRGDLAVGQPFPLGVNYWPRRKAMYWWKDFDRDEVAEEFDVIAGLGMRLVRIFLLWEDFHRRPTPSHRGAGRPRDGLRRRRRARPGPGRDLLHGAHERAQLGALVAAGRLGAGQWRPAGRERC